MKYYQATVTTTSEFADTLSVLLIELGSEGVTVNDYEDVKKVLSEHKWDYADGSLFVGGEDVFVSGYYPENTDFSDLHEKLNALRSMKVINAGTLELELKKIDSADYENEWKKYYKPIELNKVAIVPQWLKYDGDKIQVRINPGMAFGTGSHETTKLCLEFLEKTDLCGKRCADVGCGSGILGAAALKLGAEYCFMADIDSQAVEAAKNNCELNKVLSRTCIAEGSLSETSEEKYSVILANITADVLISLRNAFFANLLNGGSLIMSGIIHSRACDVKSAFSELFELAEEKSDGEWWGMLWRKVCDRCNK